MKKEYSVFSFQCSVTMPGIWQVTDLSLQVKHQTATLNTEH